MRPLGLLSLTVLLASGWTVLAEEESVPAKPYEATVTAPEVEVRSGPSNDPKMYATGKLRQGDKVRVVREENEGWLAIEPPPGSFSWINTLFLDDRAGQLTRFVTGENVPVRIGSEMSTERPTVQQVKLKRGAQVVVLDYKKAYDDNGSWLPIIPPPQEVRYIPISAVKSSPQVQTVQSSPNLAGSVNGSATPTSGGAGVDATWDQAQQAEKNGDVAEAKKLYLKLARETHDHDLSMRCHNRLHFLQENIQGSMPPGYQAGRPTEAYYPNPNVAAGNRLVPTPAINGGQAASSYPPRTGQLTSQYNYVREAAGSGTLQQPTLGQSPMSSAASTTSGPGRLRRAPFWLDQKATYVLESSQGQPRLYLTAQPGVNLEPYVNRNVDLWGPVIYRGDVKTNYMTVLQVKPLP